jgi:hypothetical protein
MNTTDVHVWAIRPVQRRMTPFLIPRKTAGQARSAATPVRYEVRWKTAGAMHSSRKRTRALAEAFQSGLRQAAQNGEEFDTSTGLPASMLPARP